MSESRFRRTLQAGEVLFREGDPGDCAFLIEHGELEVFRGPDDQRTRLAVLGPGDVIGEMAVIDQLPRTASAAALHETRLRVISATHLQQQLDVAHPLIRVLLKMVVKRYRDSMSGSTSPNTGAIEEHNAAIDRIRIAQELEEALERRQFVLHYQPVVELQRMTILGFEALIRWNHPDRGLLAPAAFLPVLEESRLINDVGRWVLDEACHALSRLNATRTELKTDPLFMAVNISARQIEDLDPVLGIQQAVTAAGIEPQRLQLEITESTLASNMNAAAQFVARCHDLGTRVAVDDFGTGYSSLNYLHRFVVDTVKIDRSFVTPMLQDVESVKILRAIRDLAEALKMSLVAEGVEDLAQASTLQDLGIPTAQGFLFARPMDEHSAAALLPADWPWAFERRTFDRRSTDRRRPGKN
jgi:diguanylate cyclase